MQYVTLGFTEFLPSVCCFYLSIFNLHKRHCILGLALLVPPSPGAIVLRSSQVALWTPRGFYCCWCCMEHLHPTPPHPTPTFGLFVFPKEGHPSAPISPHKWRCSVLPQACPSWIWAEFLRWCALEWGAGSQVRTHLSESFQVPSSGAYGPRSPIPTQSWHRQLSDFLPHKWLESDSWLYFTFSATNEFKPPLYVVTSPPSRAWPLHQGTVLSTWTQVTSVFLTGLRLASCPCSRWGAEALRGCSSCPWRHTTPPPLTSRRQGGPLTVLQGQADLPPQLHCRSPVARLLPEPLLDGLGRERGTGGRDLPHRWRLTGNLGQKATCETRLPIASCPSLPFLAPPHSPLSCCAGVSQKD